MPPVDEYLKFRYGPASNSKWLLWGHDIYGVLSGAQVQRH